MKYITDKEIRDLHITQQVCVDWVREAFLKKEDCILSPKISQHLSADSFFNTMPCCIPEFNRMGVKVVSRLPGNKPTSRSYINLFDLPTGELLTVMEADWITSMRTGAVAALAAKCLRLTSWIIHHLDLSAWVQRQKRRYLVSFLYFAADLRIYDFWNIKTGLKILLHNSSILEICGLISPILKMN